MRPWFLVALLCAVLSAGCSTLVAEPARVQPPRSIPLQIVFNNTYDNDFVRITETVWLKPYAVDAEGGLPGVRQELDKVGPESEAAGRRFDGLTTWGLRWGFNFNRSDTSCSLRNATIDLEAVITLPELEENDLSTTELELWQGYVQALRTHEDGHVNIYRTGAQELSDDFLAVGEMPDCEQLRSKLSALGTAKLHGLAQRDRDYDAQTGHGAIFPTQE
jgi:predicted secreted Zn-dependent protease